MKHANVQTRPPHFVFILSAFTERYGRVVNNPASHLGSLGFKYRPRDKLS
jgi:hypothetical protein